MYITCDFYNDFNMAEDILKILTNQKNINLHY